MMLESMVSVFWELLWKTSTLLLLTYVFVKTFRTSAANRHLLWLLCFAALALMPLFIITLPNWHWAPDSTPSAFQLRETTVQTLQRPVASGLNIQMQNDAAETASTPNASISWLHLLLGVWGSVFTVLVLLDIRAHFVFRKRARRADFFDSIRIKKDTAKLLLSTEIPVPMMGWYRGPAILIPSNFENLEGKQQRYILRHETAHVRRRDLQTDVLVRLIRNVYWFHPLIWPAYKKFINERERACDDIVVSDESNPSGYAELLIFVARQLIRRRLAPAPLAMARRSELEGRVLAILDSSAKRRPLSIPAIAAILVTALALLIPLSTWSLSHAKNRISAEYNLADELEYRQTVQTLAELLNDDKNDVIRSAVNALGNIKNPEAVDILVSRIEHHDWSTRVMVCKKLVELGHPEAAQPFIEQLSDENRENRHRAAKALEEIRSPLAIPALTHAALNDESDNVREEAVEALGELRRADLIPVFSAALQDSHQDIRRQAAWALGETESQKAVAALVTALKDDDSHVRERAVESLGDIRTRSAVIPVITMLEDPKWTVRRECVRVLVELGDSRAVEPLILRLGDDHSKVRREAVKALGAFADPRAIKPLTAALHDRDSNVREIAAETLGHFYQH